MFPKLKLARWQKWLLLIIALWMIYSGYTKLNREQRSGAGQSLENGFESLIVCCLGDSAHG